MEISRAVAFACITATKWLMTLTAVLFAALALRTWFEAAPINSPWLFVILSGAFAAVAWLMRWMAQRMGA
ncbi:MAG: hypothetical protein WCC66_06670 [Rhizobiaceae bacterium]